MAWPGPERRGRCGYPLRGFTDPGLLQPVFHTGDLAKKSFTYAEVLVRGTLSNLQEIDDLIRSQAEHWRLERMPAVDRNILRLAIYEFLYEPDVPKLVIVDEAIELAKKFGSEDSSRFVNGLLDGLLKSQNFPGVMS